MIPIHSNSNCSAAIWVSGLRPGARRAVLRPSRLSRPTTNSGAPRGRPVDSARRKSLKSSSAFPCSRSGLRCGALSRTGCTVTSASSRPARWARTLVHFQSSGRATRRARTGFRLTHRTARMRRRSSGATEAKRLWNRCPVQRSRVLAKFVERRRASPTARPRSSACQGRQRAQASESNGRGWAFGSRHTTTPTFNVCSASRSR